MQHAQEFNHDVAPPPPAHVWGAGHSTSGGGRSGQRGRKRARRSAGTAALSRAKASVGDDGPWSCSACTFLNPSGRACSVCRTVASNTSASASAEAAIVASSGLAPIKDIAAHNELVDDAYELSKAIDRSKAQQRREVEVAAARVAADVAARAQAVREAKAEEERRIAARGQLTRAERARMFAAAFDKKVAGESGAAAAAAADGAVAVPAAAAAPPPALAAPAPSARAAVAGAPPPGASEAPPSVAAPAASPLRSVLRAASPELIDLT